MDGFPSLLTHNFKEGKFPWHNMSLMTSLASITYLGRVINSSAQFQLVYSYFFAKSDTESELRRLPPFCCFASFPLNLNNPGKLCLI